MSSEPTPIDMLVQAPSRVEAVRRLGLLDSPAEESFDALTRLAQSLLGVPASFLSLVDATRDFYVSEAGLAEALAGTRELSGRSFCHLALAEDEALVINDTHDRPAWRAVPTVTSLGVRAYIGMPLRIDGEVVGSFCVVDTRPRAWSPQEVEVMTQLARSAARELGLRQALASARDESSRAREAARGRQEIVAAVAHDLRTPLQILALNMGLLPAATTPGQADCVRRMHSAVDAMKSLTESLLEEESLRLAAPPRQQSLPAAKLAVDAVNVMGLIAARARIGLTLGTLPEAQVSVDYAQLLRVLCNLIGNSLKYCPPGSAVTVGGSFAGREAQLVVTDDGPGISPADQARAFERGWQSAAARGQNDGLGLGLPIARSLVERHGGSISLVSAPGAGTAVTIHLPAQASGERLPS